MSEQELERQKRRAEELERQHQGLRRQRAETGEVS